MPTEFLHWLKTAAKEDRDQLRRYLSHPLPKSHGDFTACLWVVVGYEVKWLEELQENDGMQIRNFT